MKKRENLGNDKEANLVDDDDGSADSRFTLDSF